MRRYRSAAAMTLTAAALVGCSADEGTPPAPTATTTTTVAHTPLPAQATPPGAVGVSPGGVTTRVDVPADATESQYGQACRAAKLWLETHPGAEVEAYLKELQAPGAAGPGTFDTGWAQLTPAQQAGVVMAVNGAANDECG